MENDVKNTAADITEWAYDDEFFSEIQAKVSYNSAQADYYRRMSSEAGEDLSLEKKAERTEDCSKLWDIDIYKKHNLKQVVGVNRCHDSFCYVCQSIKAMRRFEIYAPILQLYEKDYDIYHVVFTVPNIDGRKLGITLDKMMACFAHLIRYFQGTKKIKGIDFERFGWAGAVRSLEITTGKRKEMQGNDFHPHFHCMFLLRKGIALPHEVYNSFSNDKNHANGTYLFSRLETLLQRVWCLLMLNIKVTKENLINIESMTDGRYKDGFSVRAMNVNFKFEKGTWSSVPNTPGKFHEIFKYAIKGTYKNESIFTYDEFCTLYYALKNRRVYQTYGVLSAHNFEEVDDVFSPRVETDMLFSLFLQVLQSREKPFRTQTELDAILFDLQKNKKRKQKVRYFGPSTLRKAFSGSTEEDLQGKIKEWLNELRE